MADKGHSSGDHSDPSGKHGRHDHTGEILTDIEQTMPILEIFIPEHMTVQEINPSTNYLAYRPW